MILFVLAACVPRAAESNEAIPTALTSTTAPTSQPTPVPIQIVVRSEVPKGLLDKIVFPTSIQAASTPDVPVEFGMVPDSGISEWTFCLTAPFATIRDSIALQEVKDSWSGMSDQWHILVHPSTLSAFTRVWGSPSEQVIELPDSSSLMTTLQGRQFTLAIVPFDELMPEMKVLSVDGISPLDTDFDPASYPLTFHFGYIASEQLQETLLHETSTPKSNVHPDQITSVVLTGTTALTRATANRMDTHGSIWPGEDIRAWLQSADITHISNEVSFTPTCPLANPTSTSMMFCSRPEYMDLLEYVGADVIELSGNHLLDWGLTPFKFTLEQIAEHGWGYYAGGKDLEDARKPLLLESKGSKIAFIGCNAAGPRGVWASKKFPGAAPCDFDYLKKEIASLKKDGFLVIMTFQHNENNIYEASEILRRDFRKTADYGADIVSGSQAHFPQMMEFYQGSFIHYGLGNLFFDQMDTPVPGTRREFIDRYFISQGKVISIQLQTAMLEDYARPRPMTPAERADFLKTIFEAGGYIISDQ